MNALGVISGDAQWSVDCGDVVAWLQSLPPGIAQTCITSPPYFGLRSYLGKDDPAKVHEIGSERTPEEFIAKMVQVFGAVRRVLRDDGVLWLNLGDAFDSGTSAGRVPSHDVQHGHWQAGGSMGDRRVTSAGTKTGDLLNMPHRVAQALQADGWYWRQTIVWAKRSPMPESIQGVRWIRCRVKVEKSERAKNAAREGDLTRQGPLVASRAQREAAFEGVGMAKWKPCPGCAKCLPNDGWILRRGRWRHTTAHEYVFMLTPNKRYFCDGEAVKEAASVGARGSKFTEGKTAINGGPRLGKGDRSEGDQRNPRSVLSLSSESYKGSHFATFSSALVKPFIEAATSAAGCCATCGACYAPMVTSERIPTRPGTGSKVNRASAEETSPYNGHSGSVVGNRDPNRHCQSSKVHGYRPTCDCPQTAPPQPCIVLEPFTGSGTTLQVATHLGRRAIGCELNEKYLPLIQERVPTVPRCLRTKKPKPVPSVEILPLYCD